MSVFLFAVTLRMVLGVVAAWIILRGMKQSLPMHTRALRTYLVSGLGIYFSMCCVYWATQFLPSGWVSVIFGLSPIITGILAVTILDENTLSPYKLFGMVVGVIGLTLVFGNGLEFGHEFVLGITAVLMGTLIHSLSAVLIKQIKAQVSAVAVTTGGLAIATPMFVVTWLIIDGDMPPTISPRALIAIIYLGVFASTVGFAMYYYILIHMDVSRVALITLITPICALALGNVLNNEPLTAGVMTGTGLIVTGLFIYEYGRKIHRITFKPG
ncbi:MAG: DMT family transporter [Gammaproteobacteria bacterium]